MSNLTFFDLFPSSKLSSSSFNTSTVIAIIVFCSVLCLCIVIRHLLEENRWANESITALLLGLISEGTVLLVSKGSSSDTLVFSVLLVSKGSSSEILVFSVLLTILIYACTGI